MAAHTALARQLGVSEALLDALYRIDEFRHLFTERELVALHFAEIMTTGARDVDESVIGLFNFFNRFADALQILPGSDSEVKE